MPGDFRIWDFSKNIFKKWPTKLDLEILRPKKNDKSIAVITYYLTYIYICMYMYVSVYVYVYLDFLYTYICVDHPRHNIESLSQKAYQ